MAEVFNSPTTSRQSISEFLPDQTFAAINRRQSDFTPALTNLSNRLAKVRADSEALIQPADVGGIDAENVRAIEDQYQKELDDISQDINNPFLQERAVRDLAKDYAKVQQDYISTAIGNKEAMAKREEELRKLAQKSGPGGLDSNTVEAILEEEKRRYRDAGGVGTFDDTKRSYNKFETIGVQVDPGADDIVNKLIRGFAADKYGTDIGTAVPDGNGYIVTNREGKVVERLTKEQVRNAIAPMLENNEALKSYWEQQGLIDTFNKSDVELRQLLADRSGVDISMLNSFNRDQLVNAMKESSKEARLNDAINYGTEKAAYQSVVTKNIKGLSGDPATIARMKAQAAANRNKPRIFTNNEEAVANIEETAKSLPTLSTGTESAEIWRQMKLGQAGRFNVEDIPTKFRSGYTQMRTVDSNTGEIADPDLTYPGITSAYESVLTAEKDFPVGMDYGAYLDNLVKTGQLDKAIRLEKLAQKRWESMAKQASSIGTYTSPLSEKALPQWQELFGFKDGTISGLQNKEFITENGDKLTYNAFIEKSGLTPAQFKERVKFNPEVVLPTGSRGTSFKFDIMDTDGTVESSFYLENPDVEARAADKTMSEIQALAQSPTAITGTIPNSGNKLGFLRQSPSLMNNIYQDIGQKKFNILGLTVKKTDLGFEGESHRGFSLGSGSSNEDVVTLEVRDEDNVVHEVPVKYFDVIKLWTNTSMALNPQGVKNVDQEGFEANTK